MTLEDKVRELEERLAKQNIVLEGYKLMAGGIINFLKTKLNHIGASGYIDSDATSKESEVSYE